MSNITNKVMVEMKDGNTFTVELYPQFAPKTVSNFQKLVSEGFYNGLTFHRVIDDFMAQGGCPKGNGTGGSDENIVGEFAQNGFKENTLKHERGVISMARAMNPNSASSQFFICYKDVPFLDGQYAAFGKVIDGMETVDEFLSTKRVGPEGGTPVSPIIIQRMSFVD